MAVVHVTVPVDAIYPAVRADQESFEAVLAELSCTDSLFHISRLNCIVSRPQRRTWKQAQSAALAFLGLGSATLAALNAYAERHPNSLVHPIGRGALLELIRWVVLLCRDRPGDGTTFERPEKREQLFQALLLAGAVCSKRAHAPLDRARQGGGALTAAEQVEIAWTGLREESPAPSFQLHRVRSHELITRDLVEACPELPVWFRQATGLALDDHVCAVNILALHELDQAQTQLDGDMKNTGVFRINEFGSQTANAEAFQRLLQGFSQTKDDLRSALWPTPPITQNWFERPPSYSHLPLARRPILRTADGRGVIMDPSSLCEVGMLGVVFALSARRREKALSAMGKAFQAYATRIWRELAPASEWRPARFIAEDELPPGDGRTAVPDGLIVDGQKVVLIEMKHTVIKDCSLDTDPSALLEKLLSDRLGGEKKGVGQLAGMLRDLRRHPDRAWRPEVRGARLYLPVLLVRDEPFEGPVYRLLLRRFGEQLGFGHTRWLAFPHLGHDAGWCIAPVAVLTLEELEQLRAMVPNPFGIAEVLQDYALEDPRSKPCLASFLSNSPKYRSAWRRDSGMLERASVLLRQDQERLFPSD